MRIVIVLSLLLVLNITFPKQTQVEFNSARGYVGLVFLLVYAAYNDQKERDYWAAVVQQNKKTNQDSK